jgi:hypothetical protein
MPDLTKRARIISYWGRRLLVAERIRLRVWNPLKLAARISSAPKAHKLGKPLRPETGPVIDLQYDNNRQDVTSFHFTAQGTCPGDGDLRRERRLRCKVLAHFIGHVVFVYYSRCRKIFIGASFFTTKATKCKIVEFRKAHIRNRQNRLVGGVFSERWCGRYGDQGAQ